MILANSSVKLSNYETTDFSETNDAFLRLVSIPLTLRSFDEYVNIMIYYSGRGLVDSCSFNEQLKSWLQNIKDLAELELPDSLDPKYIELKTQAIVCYITCVAAYTKLLSRTSKSIDTYWTDPIIELATHVSNIDLDIA